MQTGRGNVGTLGEGSGYLWKKGGDGTAKGGKVIIIGPRKNVERFEGGSLASNSRTVSA